MLWTVLLFSLYNAHLHKTVPIISGLILGYVSSTDESNYLAGVFFAARVNIPLASTATTDVIIISGIIKVPL